ncbi:unnamed protein product, partial [Polarella glacialis]
VGASCTHVRVGDEMPAAVRSAPNLAHSITIVPLALDAAAADVVRRLGISTEDANRCKNAFLEADTDKSGSVDLKELRGLLESLTDKLLEDDELRSLTARFDKMNGVLDFAGFLEAFCSTESYESLHLAKMIKSLGNQTRKDIEHTLADPDQRIRFVGIPVRSIRTYLDDELEQMAACLSLPFVVILFVSFCCVVAYHSRLHIVYAQKYAIMHDLDENAVFAYAENIPFEPGRMSSKNLYNVNKFADFWSWMDLGLVPRLWDSGWAM